MSLNTNKKPKKRRKSDRTPDSERIYKTHSCPENAGAHNLPKDYHKKRKDVTNVMKGIMPISDKGYENKKAYRGLWDEESLSYEVNEFFKYCFENGVKPAKAGLRIWLDLSRSQYHEWETGNHGYKTDILERAASIIELSYIGRIESFPTGNIFLLKSSHNHTDKTEIEFTNDNVDKSKIKDTIAKLGLDQTNATQKDD